MIEAELPRNERERLAALRSYDVLDSESEASFDDLTRIASSLCGTPIALVSLVDSERQWFKSRVGLEATETPRNVAFCAHAILQPQTILVVPDSLKDARFRDNPLVVGQPHVRFYAGAALVTRDAQPLGTLCVIDHRPRQLSEDQLGALQALSRQVVHLLELRKANAALKSLAHELTRTNGELQQFTSVAAHDLQEPLRQMIAFSQMLRQDLPGTLPAEASEDLRFIEQSSQRMQSLVSDLLKLARAGGGEIRREPVALEECARQALEFLSLRIAETGAEVSLDPLPGVAGDATLLTQLFQNLLANALKFVRSGRPRVRITCTTENGQWIVGVQDNGIGMDQKYAEQIFAPFKRLNGPERYEGTGIGLSICRKVVERHGGRIWVETSPGNGSHFRFTLAGLGAPAGHSCSPTPAA